MAGELMDASILSGSVPSNAGADVERKTREVELGLSLNLYGKSVDSLDSEERAHLDAIMPMLRESIARSEDPSTEELEKAIDTQAKGWWIEWH